MSPSENVAKQDALRPWPYVYCLQVKKDGTSLQAHLTDSCLAICASWTANLIAASQRSFEPGAPCHPSSPKLAKHQQSTSNECSSCRCRKSCGTVRTSAYKLALGTEETSNIPLISLVGHRRNIEYLIGSSRKASIVWKPTSKPSTPLAPTP